jgi:4-diphosphocytidyl-2-C-methyl-D-erythritol kinase
MSNSITTSTRSSRALAPAKLNLTFEILAKRTDGYHDLLTLFQTIDLYDELRFRFRADSTNQLTLTASPCQCGDLPQDFPLDDSNLIARAARLFWNSAGNLKPVRVEVSIAKNIPIGAGLAGGSANAAAALLALNEYYGHPVTGEHLLEMAAQLGSDIPFCISGGSQVGRGRGEMLTGVKSSCQLHFVIVKPKHLSVSTAWAYNAYAEKELQAPRNLECAEASITEVVRHLERGELDQFAPRLDNAFEALVFARYPLLLDLQTRLLEMGCLCAHMTGSGPSIYGLAKSEIEAQSIAALILGEKSVNQKRASQDGEPLEVFVAKSVGHGAKLVTDEKA